MQFLVNNEIVNFNHEDFPMLVSGKAFAGSGASFFSVSLMTRLFENGEKVVFFTALPPAKELFRNQLGDAINDRIIIIESGDEDLFLKNLDQIEDLSERIVLFKNIENYSFKLFNRLKNHKLIIFSGDVDKCEFTEGLKEKEFKTKIFFSYPEKMEIKNKVELPKYSGFMVNSKHKGLISIDKV